MYIPLKGAEVTCVTRVLILLQSRLCTTATFGKWQGDSYIRGDSYIQVNFAENIKQLKILGSFLVTLRYRVTAIYRAVIYRFECSVINFVRNSVRQHPIKRGQHANEVVNKPSVLILQFYRQCTCTFSIHKVFFRLDYQLLFGKWFHTPPTKRHLEGWVCSYLFPPTLIQPFLLWKEQNQTRESGRKWKENFLFFKKDVIKVQNFLPKMSASVTKTLTYHVCKHFPSFCPSIKERD